MTSPLAVRTLVTRRVTSSTVPITPSETQGPAMLIRSPKPYWRSAMMKKPASRSWTRRWAPKPSATPTTAAGATRLDVCTPRRAAICTPETQYSMTRAVQLSTCARACRCLAASERTRASDSASFASIRWVTMVLNQVVNLVSRMAPRTISRISRPLPLSQSGTLLTRDAIGRKIMDPIIVPGTKRLLAGVSAPAVVPAQRGDIAVTTSKGLAPGGFLSLTLRPILSQRLPG